MKRCDRETERQRDKEIDRQKDRKIERQKDREIERKRNRERQKDRDIENVRDIWLGILRNASTNKHTFYTNIKKIQILEYYLEFESYFIKPSSNNISSSSNKKYYCPI